MTPLNSPARRAPFRADHVGSLLRPQIIRQALYYNSPLPDLRAAEDEGIARLVKLQKDSRIKVFTDGQARRTLGHYDFMGMLDGLELKASTRTSEFKTEHRITPIAAHLTGPLDFPPDHPMLEHFRFLQALVKPAEGLAKISIPAPSAVHFHCLAETIEHKAYLDRDLLFHDIAQTYKRAVQAFYDAGCRYLQLDDICLAYLAAPDRRIDHYVWMLEEAIKDRPADMVIGLHPCRGTSPAAEGGDERAVDAIFNRTSVDVYLMAYDTDRTGGLDPLRLLPKGHKRVMAGFITPKTAVLERIDDLRRTFDAAAAFCDLDQLGIAPHCGFAAVDYGNAITEDDQKRKLQLVADTAQAIWGEV